MNTDKQWGIVLFFLTLPQQKKLCAKFTTWRPSPPGPVHVGKGTQSIWTLWRKLLKIPSCCDMTPFGPASSDYVLEEHTDRPSNLKYLLPPRIKRTYVFSINQNSISLISASFIGTITKEILTDT